MFNKTESSHKTSKFKVGDRVRIIRYKKNYRKDYTINLSREIFVLKSVLKTNLWAYKIKDLNIETIIIESFYEKELMSSKLWMSYYPEPDSHIKDKVQSVLDLTNYAPKK